MPKSLHHPKLKRLIRPISLGFIVFVTALSAFSIQVVLAITRGYNTDDDRLRPGIVVTLSQNSPVDNPKVETANRENAEKVIGVATEINNSLVTIASGDQEVYVATDGEAEAFVSDVNGEVKEGDLLVLSPLGGILMKEAPNEPVIAIALEDFSPSEADSYGIDGGQGGADITLVDNLRVNLDRLASGQSTAQTADSSLASLGRAVVGRDVGEIRLVIALIIFLAVLIAEGGIIYGAVSSAITSLGRNPLARNIIRRELIRVLFVALAVLGVGIAAIYAVLWI